MSEVSVTFERALERNGGDDKETGCYVLYNGDGYLGEICFKQGDKYEWEYVGDNLTYREQGQIASYIQTQI